MNNFKNLTNINKYKQIFQNNELKKELFLKALLSNANEAVNKLKKLKDSSEFKEELKDWEGMMEVYFEPSDNSITIVDNGIGMNQEELNSFVEEQASKKIESSIENKEISLKEVGLYFLFLIANSVNIISKKVAEETAYKFNTKDLTTYTLAPCINDEGSGTVIYIKLKDEFAKEFTTKENIIAYINEFKDELNNDLFISYYENFEEKIEKLN
ncbi:ATP-binding protein [Arcobacter sp. YIC-464]|uniref:ATP-binding protein n=1 Tax=Arcobacter sp. YIC-464 TaxID=3376631 RepID=UPI003C17B16E